MTNRGLKVGTDNVLASIGHGGRNSEGEIDRQVYGEKALLR